MARLLARAAAAVCVAALLTGCAPSPSVSPTPTPMSRAEAFAAAEATYRAYIDALNKVDLSNPATFENVYKWETGDRLASDKKALSTYHADRAVLSGRTKIRLLEPRSIEADAKTVGLNACVDVSEVAITDADGRSLIAPDRPDMQSIIVELHRDNASTSRYLVSTISGRAGTPTC